jgi:transposase
MKNLVKKGRPSKLTPERQRLVCENIIEGFSPAKAAILAGVSEKTFYNWMRKGDEEGKGKFADFYRAVKQAEAIVENFYLKQIMKAALGDPQRDIKPVWRASAWFLEHRYPSRWGKHRKINIQNTGHLDQKVDIFTEIKKLEATLQGRNKLKSQKKKAIKKRELNWLEKFFTYI